MKRKLKPIKPIYECRCNGRLQTKRFTRLTHTGLVVELEHLKIKTRLTLRWEPWYQGTRAPQPWALVPGHFFIFIFIFFGGSSFFSRLGWGWFFWWVTFKSPKTWMSHFQVSRDLDESFSSLSRLGWVTFKSLETWMSHFQVSQDLDESLSSLSRLGWGLDGESARQKILILQVFDRCVIVQGRQEGLCCIPHLPYPWGALGMAFQNRYFYLRKNLWKRRGNT
jgi:hypothetical protein